MKRHRSKKEETKSSRRGVPETAQDGNTDKESSCEETKERIPRLRVQVFEVFFYKGKKLIELRLHQEDMKFLPYNPFFEFL